MNESPKRTSRPAPLAWWARASAREKQMAARDGMLLDQVILELGSITG